MATAVPETSRARRAASRRAAGKRGAQVTRQQPTVWGEQHDRLLNFVFRAFDCCVRDRDLASAMTVDLLGAHPHLVDAPDLDDDATRSELVPLMAAALRERSSRSAIRVAVGYAAWQDRVARVREAGATEWHAAFGSIGAFTRHLRLS